MGNEEGEGSGERKEGKGMEEDGKKGKQEMEEREGPQNKC